MEAAARKALALKDKSKNVLTASAEEFTTLDGAVTKCPTSNTSSQLAMSGCRGSAKKEYSVRKEDPSCAPAIYVSLAEGADELHVGKLEDFYSSLGGLPKAPATARPEEEKAFHSVRVRNKKQLPKRSRVLEKPPLKEGGKL